MKGLLDKESLSIEQAEKWMVTMWSGEVSSDEKKSFQSWVLKTPENALAWKQVAKFDQTLAALPSSLSLKTLNSNKKHPSRRQFLQLFVLSGIGMGVSYEAHRQNWLGVYQAQYFAKVGEYKTIVLADKTELTLNSGTAVNVFFDKYNRRIELLKGEVMVVTKYGNTSNNERPLFVETRHGQARALGTRYSVRLLGNNTEVSVEQSRVHVSTKSSRSKIINAGEKITFSKQDFIEFTHASVNDFAWSSGRIVATQMPLKELVGILNKYRIGVISYDSSVENLKVSGVFSVLSTDNILQALTDVLPVKIQYRTPYWVKISSF